MREVSSENEKGIQLIRKVTSADEEPFPILHLCVQQVRKRFVSAKKEASFFVMRSTFCTFVLRKQESLQSHETPTTDTIHLACHLCAGITRDRHA
jgi:hypothetical protein